MLACSRPDRLITRASARSPCLGSPLRYHGTPQTPATPSPDIGADNAEVFAEMLGLSAAEVAALRDDGVI